MTVGELKELLEFVDDEVIIRGADGQEFTHVSIFKYDVSGHDEVCLEVE